MPKALDSAARAIIDRLDDDPRLTLDGLVQRLATAGLHVSRSAVYRHRKARQAATVAPPPDVAARVAAVAPPPAPPPPPPVDMSDGPSAVIEVLSRSHGELLDGAARARAQNDLVTFARLHATAGDLLSQIRQIQKTIAAQSVGGVLFTDDDRAKAFAEIRRRLDEQAAAQGETLVWSLDAEIPEEHGGPKLRRPAP